MGTMNLNETARELELDARVIAHQEQSLARRVAEIRLRDGRVWVQLAEQVNEADRAVPAPVREEPDGY